jgi:glutathione S-transferase
VKLVIGNKNYSSWSMRPWILLRELGVPFEEVLIPFAGLGDPAAMAAWRERVRAHAPGGDAPGKVPLLVDGEVAVWESLAILDHLADRFPERAVWPTDPAARAFARSIAAEMHAGFAALRKACPMNLGKRYAARDRGDAVARDVARVAAVWTTARTRWGQGGRFLFGAFGAADAMYAPVVARFLGYDLPAAPVVRAYLDAVAGTAGYRGWTEAALAEPWVEPQDEVDEPPVAVLRAAAR